MKAINCPTIRAAGVFPVFSTTLLEIWLPLPTFCRRKEVCPAQVAASSVQLLSVIP